MEDGFSVFVNGDIAEAELAQDSHRAVAVGTDMCGKVRVGCEGDDLAADLAVPAEERFDRVIGIPWLGTRIGAALNSSPTPRSTRTRNMARRRSSQSRISKGIF